MVPSKKLAILASFSGEGGVEKMLVNLIKGMSTMGYNIDLLLIKSSGAHLAALPHNINIIKLGSSHTFLCLPSLVQYLRKHQPSALLVAKHRALLVALWARRLAQGQTRIVGRLGTHLTASLQGKGGLKKILWHYSMRKFYPWADQIVAVSEGVAHDILAITALSPPKVCVIRNPVITPELYRLAQEKIDHPWLKPASAPLILGVGRFTVQKDFSTLIKAFALVRQQIPCKLMILGKGPLRPDYETLITELGIIKDVALPGFATNPYAYLAQAKLFVLSSQWEGSPNVLTEALALGVPVVATDCPSGPREILQNGRYGPLVKIGDVEGLAAAMLATLRQPLDPATLKNAVAEYTVENSARHYLQALGL